MPEKPVRVKCTSEQHGRLQIGALAGKHEEGLTLKADMEMEVNLAPQTELLGQTLHTVTKVLEVQQQ